MTDQEARKELERIQTTGKRRTDSKVFRSRQHLWTYSGMINGKRNN